MHSVAPRYLLRLNNQTLGPDHVQLRSGQRCSAFYGFSDKESYDRFQANSSLQLTPYPLVDVFLQDQAKASVENDRPVLIVMNPKGPDCELLQAVTARAVMRIREQNKTELMSTHVLMFDKQAAVYLVDEIVMRANVG